MAKLKLVQRGSTMKKLLILTVLALTILGGTEAIETLVSHQTVVADCGSSNC
jgi:hypothetical protein